jgi:hypothetical protein
MLRLRSLLLALSLLAVPVPAHALLLDYLTVPGIVGEAGPPGPAGSIELLSVSWVPGTLTVVKLTDASSPSLFLAAAQGIPFAGVQLDRFDTDVSPTQPVQSLVFLDVLVSSFTSLGGEVPAEQVTFAFAQGPVVPEPATAGFLALGVLALGARARRSGRR